MVILVAAGLVWSFIFKVSHVNAGTQKLGPSSVAHAGRWVRSAELGDEWTPREDPSTADRGLPSYTRVPGLTQRQQLGGNWIQLSCVGGRNPSFCAITCCLPGWAYAGNWNGKQSLASHLGALRYGVWVFWVVTWWLHQIQPNGFLTVPSTDFVKLISKNFFILKTLISTFRQYIKNWATHLADMKVCQI